MGCWNKTCGLSGLHIEHGEDVVVFVLEDHTKAKDRCYNTALFTPVIIPFYSKYDDYGGGEDSHGVGLELVLTSLNRQLVERDQGSNEFHDIPVKKSDFDEDKLFKSILKQRLQIQSLMYPDRKIDLDLVMFKKSVVDSVLSNLKLSHYDRPSGERIEFSYDDIIADVPSFVEQMHTTFKEKGRGYIEIFGMNFFNSRDTLIGNKVSWVLLLDKYRYSGLIDLSNVITDALTNDQLGKACEILQDHILMIVLDRFMNSIRRVWIPGCFEGSQANDHSGYKILCNAITSIIEAEKHKWDDEFDDDGETE